MDRPMNRRAALMGGAALAAATLADGGSAQMPRPRMKLRLLATSDLHATVAPYDYFRGAGDDTVGLARTASLIRAAQAEVENSLLLDNGDFIQGSALGDYIAERRGLKPGDLHPVAAAMNALPYLCGTIGNHEFNYGLEFLQNTIRRLDFPLVCANVEHPRGQPLVDPWRLFEHAFVDAAGERYVLKLGVIGFVPPQIMLWDKAHLEGRLRALDIVDAAQKHLPALLATKPDIVIALCHSGMTGAPRRGGEENAALFVAGLSGIDIVVSGHQHLVFPGAPAFEGLPGVDNVRGTLAGKPACQPGFCGSHLGVIDLSLERRGERWHIAGFAVENRPIFTRAADGTVSATVASDPAVLAAVAGDHEATLAYMDEPVGATRVPIHSYFALVADDASVQIVSDAQAARARALIADTPWRDLPVLSAAAPFKAGGRSGPGFYTDIPAGPLALRHIADLYLYPNTLQIVKVTGADVRAWLERAAGLFNRIDPSSGTEQPLIDPAFPAFNFDVIDGVTYRIDVTRPSRYDAGGALVAPDARRILDLRFRGAPIDEAAEFLIATNNYRASGGGNFPGTRTTIVLEAPDLVRDVLVRHVVAERSVAPAANGNWSLAPLPEGVFATFLTAPLAADRAPDGLRAEPIGAGPDGFVRWRLTG